MKDQISRRARQKEMDTVKEMMAKASQPFTDYRKATFWQLEHAAKNGDQKAMEEMTRRKGR